VLIDCLRPAAQRPPSRRPLAVGLWREVAVSALDGVLGGDLAGSLGVSAIASGGGGLICP
jgi:hypothetical protein